MSADEGDDGGPGNREVAYRLFAAEFEDADFTYAESDEERAPNYVVTPTGARVNRMFVVGVLTEVESVGEDILRARVVDPTGAVVIYAGQYQPDAKAFFERAEPPTFLAVSGKARTFQPEDSDVIYTSLRPESVNEVDAETRDRWTVRTAERTLDRVGTMAAAKDSGQTGDALRSALLDSGVAESLASGIPLALDHYETTGSYLAALRTLALDATRVVAGDREEAGSLSLSPDEGSDADVTELATMDVEAAAEPTAEPADASDVGAVSTEVDSGSSTDTPASTDSGSADSTTSADTGTTTSGESTTTTEATASPTDDTAPSSTETESAAASESETTTATETELEPTATAAAGSEDSGGSPSPADRVETSTDEEDIGDFEPGEFDLDEETREEVESEYGTDFQSGSEVEQPGAADIDTPDPEDLAAAEESVPETAAESEPAATESTTDPDASTEETASPDTTEETASPDTATQEASSEPVDEATGTTEDAASGADAATGSGDAAEDVDLEDAVMDAMEELDDGDGADREAVIEAVVKRTGAGDTAVEDAVQSALMSGRCYEPDDTTLKSI